MGGIEAAYRVWIRYQDRSSSFHNVSIVRRPASLDAGWVGGDRVRGEFHRAQRQHIESGAGAGRRSWSSRESELNIQAFLLGQIGNLQRQIAGHEHQFPRRRDSLAGADEDSFGVIPRIGRARERYLQTVDDLKPGRLREVSLPLEKVILLPRQIARCQEAAIEPERSCALAVENQRTVAAIDSELLRSQRDPRVASGERICSHSSMLPPFRKSVRWSARPTRWEMQIGV